MSSGSDDESYIISAERKAKQNFLREEIVENHYDPQLFMMFCAKKIEPDVDYWDFDELQECVHDFKMTYRRGETLKDVQEAEEKKSKKKAPKGSVENKSNNPESPVKLSESIVTVVQEKVNYEEESLPIPTNKSSNDTDSRTQNKVAQKKTNEKNKLATEVLFADLHPQPIIESPSSYTDSPETLFTISCKRLERNELSSAPSLEFIIKAPEHVEAGFFSQDYYLYPVCTSPLAWECKRKFIDYIWLQETLTTLLPGNFIPPLPPHKSLTSTEQDNLTKRKALLIKFTAALARNTLMLSLPVVEKFFKIPSYDEFTEYKKKIQKSLKRPEIPENLYSLTGALSCNTVSETQRADVFVEYATAAESIEKRLKREVTKVMKGMAVMAERYRSISDTIHQLEILQETVPYKTDARYLCNCLTSSFAHLSEVENGRKQAVKEHFNMYFKYSYLEKDQMKILLKERQNMLSEYQKALIKKKDVEKHKNMFGFYNINAIQEIERTVHEENAMINKNFSIFAKKGADLTTSLHAALANTSSLLPQL